MHVSFIAYGARNWVEHLYRDMEAQKFQLRVFKDGEADKAMWLQGVLRLLPGGIMDYVFPKEYADIVLHTLTDNKAPNRYKVPPLFMKMLVKGLGLKPIPSYKKDEKLLWISEHVSIIVLGMREDSILQETKGSYAGWSHESL